MVYFMNQIAIGFRGAADGENAIPAISYSALTIRLERYRIDMFLGLHEFEQTQMQPVEISAHVELTDATVFWDYDALKNHIESYRGMSIGTQEELVKRVLHFIFGCGNVASATVSSNKPTIFAAAESVGISISGRLCGA